MNLIKREGFFSPMLCNLHSDCFEPNYFNFGAETRNWSSTTPRVNISELDDHYQIDLAAPGYSKGDFNVEIDDGKMIVSAQLKESEEGGSYTTREFNSRSFSRTFFLPDTVNGDAVDAKYEAGILNIVVPKKDEMKKKPLRTIPIK